MTIMYTIYYMFANQVADYTAGRELHPAPKNFLISFSIYVYILQPIILNVNYILKNTKFDILLFYIYFPAKTLR